MVMHAARIDSSERLRRVRAFLADGAWHTTLAIVTGAQVCAVNSIVAELRENGFEIACRRQGDRWYYRLESTDSDTGSDRLKRAQGRDGSERLSSNF